MRPLAGMKVRRLRKKSERKKVLFRRFTVNIRNGYRKSTAVPDTGYWRSARKTKILFRPSEKSCRARPPSYPVRAASENLPLPISFIRKPIWKPASCQKKSPAAKTPRAILSSFTLTTTAMCWIPRDSPLFMLQKSHRNV